MINFTVDELAHEFTDNDSCLELLKNKIYPYGVRCAVCKKVTKHHKLTKRACYCCDICGNQVYPTSGTIFHKSTTPLKTWFEAICMISTANSPVSAKRIQKEYGVTYKTARRMLQQIGKLLDGNATPFGSEIKPVLTPNNRRNANTSGGKSKIPPDRVSIKKDKKIDSDVPNVGRSSRVPYIIDKNTEGSYLDTHGSPVRDPFTVSDFKIKEKLDKSYWKRDRTARLLKLQMQLWQHPNGMSIEEISKKCSVSLRTAYRDLNALESELEVPIWEEGSIRGIVEGYFLPAVPFTLMETIQIFLAIRLMQRCSYLYNPGLVSTIMKLNNIIPSKLRQQVLDTLGQMERQPRDERRIRNLNKLIEAWLSAHMVKFTYHHGNKQFFEDKVVECIVKPYSIEPSEAGHSNYLIASSYPKESIEVFKIDNISGDVQICSDDYEIPTDFNANDYLSHSWDVNVDNNELITAKIHFSRKSNVIETIWHPSQVMQPQKDGSVILTLRVRNTRDFLNWVLGWGVEAEVLEPETLKNQITKHAQALVEFYSLK